MFGMARLYRARRKRTIGRILISAHPPQGFPHPNTVRAGSNPYQTVPDGDFDEVAHGTGLQFGEQVVLMGFHGFGTDAEILGNAFDSVAVGQKT